MRGYKAFNADWTCRGFQYKVGETYKMDGEITICDRGFHFCTDLADCFGYYGFSNTNRYAEIEASGVILSDINSDSKRCTNEITIVREIPWDEVLRLCNTGKGNTGHRNTGNQNTGSNNAGNRNTGYWNAGCRNTGDWNEGDWNAGDRNTGSYNTGYSNTGNHNTGDWNTANYSSGCFCTESEYIKLFDKPSTMTLLDWRNSKAYLLLTYDMNVANKYERQIWYDSLSNEDKQEILNIPNFDPDKFLLCTGIDVRKTK